MHLDKIKYLIRPSPINFIKTSLQWHSFYNSFTKLSYTKVAPMSKKFDIVVYGATGFTGQYVVEEMARVAKLEKEKGQFPILKWAVAGRNKEKVLSSLSIAEKITGIPLKEVEVLEADVEDVESLNEMASQARVVINCVGPYHLYGEPVVKACIDHGSNHVDISGETLFLEGMRLKYDKLAEEAGVHIVGACGYDSVPADVGLCHMIKKFPGVLNSAECFVRTKGGRGSSIHTGTMESAALAIATRSKVQEIRRQLYTKKLPKPKYRKEKRGLFHKNTDLDKSFWALPLPTDEPQVMATQRYLSETKGQKPVQFQGFIAFPSFFQAFGTMLGAAYFIVLCMFGWTRNLLLKYPEAMTAGVFTRKGSSREQLEGMSFTSTIIGKGWTKKLVEPSDEYSTPPDTKIIVTITGPDPGYGATSLMMVASAMTILREKASCERRGGLMPPGTAFMNTNLIERLMERGMKVTVDIQGKE